MRPSRPPRCGDLARSPAELLTIHSDIAARMTRMIPKLARHGSAQTQGCLKAARRRDHPPRRKRRSGIGVWTESTIIVPIVLSAGALAVAGLTYHDQHNADTAATVAAEQQLADQVAFWVDDSGGGSKSALLEIQNRSSVPISDVSATIGFASLPGKPPPPPDSVADFNIGLVPPCSIAIIPLTGHWTGGGPASEFFQNAVSGRTAYLSDLRFTDANDQNWDEDGAGILTPQTTVPSLPAVVPPAATIRQATGCS